MPPPFSPPAAAGNGGPCGAAAPLTILTIGHSNQDSETFLSLLRQHRLGVVVDVRSAPYSRYAPQFSQAPLRSSLDAAGIRYLWVGDLLGGRPADPACYRDGVINPRAIDYAAMARQPWYHAGIERLLAEAANAPTALLCSEEDPRRCHRHRLIEPTLRERGVAVRHIRGDGTLDTIDERTVEESMPSPQLALSGFEP